MASLGLWWQDKPAAATLSNHHHPVKSSSSPTWRLVSSQIIGSDIDSKLQADQLIKPPSKECLLKERGQKQDFDCESGLTASQKLNLSLS